MSTKATVSPENGTESPSYREAYTTLQRIVTELEQGDADLDRLLPLLDEARAAYDVCQERVRAVSSAMQQAEWLRADRDDMTATDEDE